MSKIKSIKYIGKHQTYDLEVDHPDHQFYLQSGVLTSNSHALAYAYVSYQCSFLYHYYPDEWVCAYLENDPDRDKAIAEVSAVGYKIGRPDILKSEKDWIVYEKTLIPSLSTVKGIGDAAIDEIIEIRKNWVRPDLDNLDKNSFKNLFESFFYDFIEIQQKKGIKIKKKWKFSKFNKRAMEALIKCESLDELGFIGPGRLFENYAHAYRVIIEHWDKKEQLKFDILELAEKADTKDWLDTEKIEFQSEFIGTYDKELLIDEETIRSLEEAEIYPLEFVSSTTQSHWFILNDFVIKKTNKGKQYYRLIVSDVVGSEKILNYFGYTKEPLRKKSLYACDLRQNGEWLNACSMMHRIR